MANRQIDPSKVYPPGHERAGEPMVVGRRAARQPGPAAEWLHVGAGYDDDDGMPLITRKRAELLATTPAPIDLDEARARVMGWRRGTAAKFLPGMKAEPGEVPSEGTPTQVPMVQGSALPVIAASRRVEQTAGKWAGLIDKGQVLAPPYDPFELVCAVEESDTLPQAIAAMATNVGGFGYELLPLFPTHDPDTGEPVKPPPEAVAEREQLELFLASCNLELGLPGLLELADTDAETIGWATVEVLRNAEGDVAAFEHVPAYTMRLGRTLPRVLVECPFRHPTTGKLVTIPRWRTFRLYVQITAGRTVYFKSFGDPRFVNSATGEVGTTAWGKDDQGNDLNATEVIFRRIYAPHTPYGVPRWVGGSPHVRAGREAAELLVDWFLNAPIGMKLALVAGGTFKADSLADALDKIDHGARGSEHAWSLVTLEAERDSTGDPIADEGKDKPPTLALEDVTYEVPATLYTGENNLIDGSHRRVRRMFRLPAIYFGDSEAETNRAAADTARGVAEEQVFRPLRSLRWETLFNSELFPSMGINYWKLHLSGAVTGDNEAAFKGLGPFNEGGGTSVNSLRRVFAETVGLEAPGLINEPWADKPLPLVLELVKLGLDPNKSLADLAADVEAKAEQARQDAKDALDAKAKAGPGAPGGPPSKGPPSKGAPAKGAPPARPTAAKGEGDLVDAGDTVRGLVALRAALLGELTREAREADELPEHLRDRGV